RRRMRREARSQPSGRVPRPTSNVPRPSYLQQMAPDGDGADHQSHQRAEQHAEQRQPPIEEDRLEVQILSEQTHREVGQAERREAAENALDRALDEEGAA